MNSERGAKDERAVYVGGAAFGLPYLALLPIDLQRRCVGGLQELIRGSSAYQAALAEGSVTALSETGRIVVLFRSGPVAALECAAEVGALAAHELPDLPARVVIHAGACYATPGFDGRPTLAGGVVQMLRDLLEHASEGGILVSDVALAKILDCGALPGNLGESGRPVERVGTWYRRFVLVERGG